ncbi:MAG: hypothetical protein JNK15_20505 [Planctomycetes bacterium]|nr:hypothetical protein [Planctomycetota bacterium]
MNRSWLAAALLGSLAPGQAPTGPTESSTRLHTAWIREMLDLDTRGAIADYEAIAQDARPANLERWVAVARLLELQRTGVAGSHALPLADAPEVLREAIAKLPPTPESIPLLPLLADPAVAWASLSSNAIALPELRPLAEVVLRWHRTQGVGERQRMAQRFSALNQNRARAPQGDAPRTRWANAFSVLRAEQQGQQALATELRRFDFPDWKANVPTGDPTVLLQRVRIQLDAWLGEANLGELQRTQLRTLRDAVELRPAKEIVEMIGRVPLVGERLLAEPKPADAKPDEPKPGDGK